MRRDNAAVWMSTGLGWVTSAMPRSFTHAGARGRELAPTLGKPWRAVVERSRSRNHQPAIATTPAPATAKVTRTTDDVAHALAGRPRG